MITTATPQKVTSTPCRYKATIVTVLMFAWRIHPHVAVLLGRIVTGVWPSFRRR